MTITSNIPNTPSSGFIPSTLTAGSIVFSDGTQLTGNNPTFFFDNANSIFKTVNAQFKGPSPWIDVKSYGAKGDGVTDDTTAIQAALTAAGALTKATVLFSYGNYIVSSQLTISGTRITLMGAGQWASTITSHLVGNPADSLFLIGSTNDYVRFEGIRFVGNNISGAGGNGHAIAAIGQVGDFASFLHIRHCEFQSFSGNGKDNTGASMLAASLYVYAGLDITVEDCDFTGGQYGVVFQGTSSAPSNKLLVTGSNFDSIQRIAIKADYAENLIIDDMCVFNNIGGNNAGDAALAIDICHVVNIIGSRFKQSNGNSILANSANQKYNINIIGNYFFAFGATAQIDIGTSVENCSIIGNEITWDSTVVGGAGINFSNPAGFIGFSYDVFSNSFYLGGAATVTDIIKFNNATNAIKCATIRNNFFGQEGTPAGAQVITNGINLSGAGGIAECVIEYNGFFMSAPGTFTNGIVVGSAATDTIIKQNFFTGLGTTVSDSGTRTCYWAGGKLGLATANPLASILHVGPGQDSPSLGSNTTALYLTQNGATALAVRDSTNHIETVVASSGGVGFFGTRTNHSLQLQVNGTSYWQVSNATGGLLAVNDNQVPIGAAGANRPSAIHISSVFDHGNAGTPTVNFFGAGAASQQTSGANLTNNVTVGGTTDTIADFSDLTTYSNSAAAIRNDIYQLARKLKQVNDALRLYGLLT